MAEGLIKKTKGGVEYVDEDEDRTLDAIMRGLKEGGEDSEPDEDEEEIMAAWLPKAFPDDPDRQMVGRPMSVPELEGELENQQFLKSDEERGLNLKK